MAKRTVKSKKATGKKPAAKKPIESYDHKAKKRTNNPPVGLVTPDTPTVAASIGLKCSSRWLA